MGVGFTKGPFSSKGKHHLSKTLGFLASDLPLHQICHPTTPSPVSSERVEARAVCG